MHFNKGYNVFFVVVVDSCEFVLFLMFIVFIFLIFIVIREDNVFTESRDFNVGSISCCRLEDILGSHDLGLLLSCTLYVYDSGKPTFAFYA